MLATQCSLAMQEHLHDFKADECTLTLHMGIGSGMVSGIHVGVPDHMEFFIAGDPLEQVAECEVKAQPGEVYISHEAAKAIFDSIQVSIDVKDAPKDRKGPPKKKILSKLDDSTCYRLEKATNPVELPPTLPLPHAEQTKNMISPYVQPAVLGHLSSGSPEHFLAELRSISVIFVNVGLTFSTEGIPKIQEAMKAMQAAVYHYEGTVRQVFRVVFNFGTVTDISLLVHCRRQGLSFHCRFWTAASQSRRRPVTCCQNGALDPKEVATNRDQVFNWCDYGQGFLRRSRQRRTSRIRNGRRHCQLVGPTYGQG